MLTMRALKYLYTNRRPASERQTQSKLNKELSYRKQIARQHSCYRNVGLIGLRCPRTGDVETPVKVSSRYFDHQTKFGFSVWKYAGLGSKKSGAIFTIPFGCRGIDHRNVCLFPGCATIPNLVVRDETVWT